MLLFPAPELLLPPLHAAGLEPTVAELERAHYRAMADCDRPGREWPNHHVRGQERHLVLGVRVDQPV